MTAPPADGERRALRGYRWQYDHIAALVYDALVDDTFISFRLTDPKAGKVDDLVLVTRAGVHGYQFKSAEFDGFINFAQIRAARRTRSGKPTPSLLRELSDGWQLLEQLHGAAQVHLVAQPFPSVHDHLAVQDDTQRPTPDHFQAFIAHVLTPIRRRTLAVNEVPRGWSDAVGKIQLECALSNERLTSFLRALHLDLGPRDALSGVSQGRRSDIVALSDTLYREVSNSSDVVTFDRPQLLELMNWQSRPRLRSVHDFPVDLDTYAPLESAITALHEQLAVLSKGYVAEPARQEPASRHWSARHSPVAKTVSSGTTHTSPEVLPLVRG